ncbi:MAG: hypothetical protein ABIP51_07825 [Bacteroidia bacterium]
MINKEDLSKTGDFAELQAHKFCEENGYLIAGIRENRFEKIGIDFLYIKNKKVISVDVKSTHELYVCNFDTTLKNKKRIINVRHPFKSNTDSDELWIWDKFKNDWHYQGDRTEYLLRFFYSQKQLNMFLNYLKNVDCTVADPLYPLKTIKQNLEKYVCKSILTVGEFEKQKSLKMITSKDLDYLKDNGSYFLS